MKKLFNAVMVLVLALLLIGVNFALAATPTPQPATPAPATKTVAPAPMVTTPASPAVPAWQQEWEKTVAAAKKEGKVNIISARSPKDRAAIAAAFKGKYGLDTEYLAGSGGEVRQKILFEQNAGQYNFDVELTGASSVFGMPETVVPLEPYFILPEVKDPSLWRDGELPFRDPERKFFAYLGRVGAGIAINTDMVKREEITSWKDLLYPKWKGKILMNDPSVAGAGNAVISAVGEIMGHDFLRELAKQQPVINRNGRLQVEWVAKGKYPVAIAYKPEILEEYRGLGAPVDFIIPKEGTYFGAGGGFIFAPKNPPHPSAAKLFINWFLSREGQIMYTKVAVEQSTRMDIPQVLPPERLPKKGVKYFLDDGEAEMQKKAAMKKLAKKIFADLYK